MAKTARQMRQLYALCATALVLGRADLDGADNAGFDHFVIQIITLSGSFSDTCKDGDAAMLFGNVVDKLLDQNCLADTCAAEQTDLAASRIWRDQVNDLDAGFINF